MLSNRKKIAKVVIILMLIIGLAGTSTAIFWVATFDQEWVKKQAFELVKKKSGRELKINGKISCLFFPMLGIKAQDIVLSNLPAFKNSDLIKIGEASFKIKWLPLLFGNIIVDKLIFKELDLNLVTGDAAANNWQDLIDLNAKHAPDPKQNRSTLNKFTLNFLAIENGTLTWQNQQNNQKIKINRLNLRCQDLNFSRPFEIIGSFDLLDSGTILINQGQLKLEAKLDLDQEQYSFRKLQWSGRFSNESKTIQFYFNGATELDFKKTEIVANNFKLQLSSPPELLTNDSKFSGTADLVMNHLTLSGTNHSERFKNLNGSGQLTINQGSYHGVDVAYEINRAHALLNNQPSPAKKTTRRTKFEQLTASFKIDNSKLKTDDILILATDYKITGAGQINLNSEELRILCHVYGANDQSFYIPARITGRLTDPVITFDVVVLVKQVVKVVKNVLQQPVEKLKHNLPQELKKILPF